MEIVEWYALMSNISLQANLYMIREDQVFVADVVVIDSIKTIMAMSVISRLVSVAIELNIIVKIDKYRKFHEANHFITMAMELHNTPEHDMDYFIKKCARLFHDKQSRGHLSLSFCIQFFKQHVNIVFNMF
jgi:hypothetical protein